jgi:hypothetical protein
MYRASFVILYSDQQMHNLLTNYHTPHLTHWHTQPAVRQAEPSMPLLLIPVLCQ